MVKLLYGRSEYSADKAVKTETEVILFDDNRSEILHLSNITENEWQYISLEEGEWSDLDEIPSDIDILRADVDYLLMLSETEN